MGAVSASQATNEVAVRRCPGCGRRLERSYPRQCPLCDYAFEEDSSTGADVTPYARSFAAGKRCGGTMTAWVWSARTERLKHLALMRRSAASARFSHLRILLLAGGLALFQVTVSGWYQVMNVSAVASEGIKPVGQGWFQVGSGLWWNPAQAIVVGACAFISAWLLMRIVLALLRAGGTLAHGSAYRGQRRMTAAIDYSLAWAAPALIALAILPFRVIGRIGAAVGWVSYPPSHLFDVIAGIMACGALILLWFWLIRLGATAPERARGRVTAFFVLGPPVLATGAALIWWFGLDRAYGPLFEWMKLSF